MVTALQLTKKWAKENKIGPVMYCVQKSQASENLKKGLDHLVEERIKVLLNEKAKIEKKLIESVDKSTTQAMLGNLRQELEEIIEHLKLNSGGHPISRNQGLVIDNFIFGKIIWDISGAFNANGIPVPNYYFEIDGDFDHQPIKNFLSKKLKELQKVKLNELNYLKLKDWVSNLKDQIRAFWEEENTKIKSTVKY